jgi:hypothetical protein
MLVIILPGYITTPMTDDDNDRLPKEEKKRETESTKGSFFFRQKKDERKKRVKKERKNSYAPLFIDEHDNLLIDVSSLPLQMMQVSFSWAHRRSF